MTFKVHIENGCEQTFDLPQDQQFQLWVETALHPFRDDGEVNIRIVENDEMTELNGQFRNKHKATNVLAFAYHPGDDEVQPLLGDIAICAPVVMAEATQQHKLVEHHWAHLVMHGTLHLLGFDHIDDDDAEQMEQQERELLAQLSIADPYEVNQETNKD